MSRVPLIFGIVSILVGLGSIGYVYRTDPVRQALACRVETAAEPCGVREDLAIAAPGETDTLDLAAALPDATTLGGAQ